MAGGRIHTRFAAIVRDSALRAGAEVSPTFNDDIGEVIGRGVTRLQRDGTVTHSGDVLRYDQMAAAERGAEALGGELARAARELGHSSVSRATIAEVDQRAITFARCPFPPFCPPKVYG